jgi:hypothetical protein
MTPGQREYLGEGDTAVLDRPADRDEAGFGDWYALRLEEPERCRGCGYSSPFYWDNLRFGDKAAHVVVVWPSEDDPALLRLMAKQPGEPVPFDASFGEAESWYKVNPS